MYQARSLFCSLPAWQWPILCSEPDAYRLIAVSNYTSLELRHLLGVLAHFDDDHDSNDDINKTVSAEYIVLLNFTATQRCSLHTSLLVGSWFSHNKSSNGTLPYIRFRGQPCCASTHFAAKAGKWTHPFLHHDLRGALSYVSLPGLPGA